MADRSYMLILQLVLAANGTGTLQFPMPQGEFLELDQMVFSSTGAFAITDIRDSSGNHFTNASVAVALPSTVLASGANNNNALKDFFKNIFIDGGNILYVDVKDTSGAGNTVNLAFMGRRGDKASA